MPQASGLTYNQALVKRCFDIILSGSGLLILGWLILLLFALSAVTHRSSGFFLQERVGLDGKCFVIIKIKTMFDCRGGDDMASQSDNLRVTKLGKFMRKSKLDELPQLWNVLIGEMSLVGPRPDVQGFADRLVGDNRIILSVRPGITGPASIVYFDEETMMKSGAGLAPNSPDSYWPEKVRINADYVRNWSFKNDLHVIRKTIIVLIQKGCKL